MGDTKQLDKIQIVQGNARSLASEGKSKLPKFYDDDDDELEFNDASTLLGH